MNKGIAEKVRKALELAEELDDDVCMVASSEEVHGWIRTLLEENRHLEGMFDDANRRAAVSQESIERLTKERSDFATMYFKQREEHAMQFVELQQLREELKQVKNERDRFADLRLHRMEIENGAINFGISGEAGMAFAAILFKFYEDNGGKNFFSFDIEKDEKRFNITITNLNGEMSIVEKANQLSAELQQAKKEREEVFEAWNESTIKWNAKTESLRSQLAEVERSTKRTVPDMSKLNKPEYKQIHNLYIIHGSGYLISVLRHFDHLSKIPDIFSPERYSPNGAKEEETK